MVLYYLKDQGHFSMTANMFGVTVPTMSKVVRQVTSVINSIHGPSLIKFPETADEILKTAKAFEDKFGVPQIIGCVDGTHIPIIQPRINPRDYYCYKMKYSLSCQAVCDQNGLFTDIDISWPGSVHDARVFANSSINKKFINQRFPACCRELIPGDYPVPPFLIGDPAYPLLPHLMKEYPNCTSNEQVVFNEMIRSARNQIKCAFGRLKARWRILNRALDVSTEIAPQIIYTCFVLHNFCELRNGPTNDDEVQNIIEHERRTQACQHHSVIDRLYTTNTSEGINVRKSLTSYFKEYLP